MRRLLLCIFTGGFFLGLLTGCGSLGLRCHTQGICDCDHDDDPCTHRAAWVRHNNTYPIVQTNTTPAPAPAPAPVTTATPAQ